MNALNKTSNGYADMLPNMYARTPKAVFAALALSFAIRLDPEWNDDAALEAVLVEEWQILHANGIVPQKPPK